MGVKLSKEEEFLRTSEVVEELENYGIKLTEAGLRKYVREGFIPDSFVKLEKHGRKHFYYFKPEVVDYLVRKLRGF